MQPADGIGSDPHLVGPGLGNQLHLLVMKCKRSDRGRALASRDAVYRERNYAQADLALGDKSAHVLSVQAVYQDQSSSIGFHMNTTAELSPSGA